MTDQNTASPVSEIEMSTIRSIFERAANAIVQASDLTIAVNDLSSRVERLVQDIEYAQAKNRELDTMLHDTREQRDRAKAELDQVKSNLTNTTHDLQMLQNQARSDAEAIHGLQDKLTKAQDEAKGWEQAALKSDQELQEAKAKLAKVQALFGQPVSEPLPVNPPQSPPSPVEQVKPEPLTQHDPGFDWNKPYHWDMAKQAQVQD